MSKAPQVVCANHLLCQRCDNGIKFFSSPCLVAAGLFALIFAIPCHVLSFLTSVILLWNTSLTETSCDKNGRRSVCQIFGTYGTPSQNIIIVLMNTSIDHWKYNFFSDFTCLLVVSFYFWGKISFVTIIASLVFAGQIPKQLQTKLVVLSRIPPS